MHHSPPQPQSRRPTLPDFYQAWTDWLIRLLLAGALTGLIIRGHGCHPGGHDDEIDDELVHREHPSG